MQDHEQKLDEAKYFYDLMVESYQKELFKQFTFQMSAFLTAARSIIQYTYEQATNLRRVNDYNKLIETRPILRYFKEKRDINIHAKPVKPIQQVNLDLHSTLTIRTRESISIQVTEEDGSVSRDEKIEIPSTRYPEQKKEIEETGLKRTLYYRFEDWQGNEDVLTLSKQYLDNLYTLINEAHSIGLI
ncbi:hypothetical protein ACTHPF_27300 [Paenibacillus sp. SAF-054]|uniref:hypothetical protein n=1 Tax=Paenibacillus sp. SAF-054 TaxID=3436863 RepID=UPI003F7FA3AD